ncbi:RrF2 family transcriptional regulator [Dechloromonas sp. A34]|uniref:RrF2 family transcriptional regulator n=1 Tax=Dechloromonas sp. A34 TaxID=447588 RepID=UPI0022495618|nr:Rrf2 family transcriptional regulator [Dechloromonas sp. A34]
MHLTTFTDYTLRVLIYLALEPERLATIPEMASAYGISENHLMKVVHRLARSGTIESVRGKGGGVRLARPPAEIRLGEVIRASEGDSAIVECFSGTANSCRIAPVCRLTKILGDAFAGLYQSLDAFTLADLCTNDGEIRGRFPARGSLAIKQRAS